MTSAAVATLHNLNLCVIISSAKASAAEEKKAWDEGGFGVTLGKQLLSTVPFLHPDSHLVSSLLNNLGEFAI